MNDLRERNGLPRDDELTGLEGRVFFTTRPLSLRPPDVPLPEVTAELRPIADDRHAGDTADAADPFPARDGRPRVAVTLGTINQGELAVLHAMIDGALAAGAHVVVALGADPASLGPVPPDVAVRAYAPMSTLLPAADVVVFHGGSGTMLAALAAGTPMVIVPLAADQPDNAELCAAAGVARVVPLDGVDASGLRAAIEDATTDPTVQRRAQEVAAEVAAMPGPEVAIERLEAIVEGEP
jgi:MGT family glycosyltransferase